MLVCNVPITQNLIAHEGEHACSTTVSPWSRFREGRCARSRLLLTTPRQERAWLTKKKCKLNGSHESHMIKMHIAYRISHIGHQVQGGSGDFVRVYSRDLGDWQQSWQYLQTALQVIGYRWVREDKDWPDRKSTLSDNIFCVYERLHPIKLLREVRRLQHCLCGWSPTVALVMLCV